MVFQSILVVLSCMFHAWSDTHAQYAHTAISLPSLALVMFTHTQEQSVLYTCTRYTCAGIHPHITYSVHTHTTLKSGLGPSLHN